MTAKSLREQHKENFNNKAQADLARRVRKACGEEQLEKMTSQLKAKIQQAIDKDKGEIVLRVKKLSPSDVRVLAGYRKLHEICAGNDVDMAIMTGDRHGFWGRYTAIIVTLDKSYNESPDARTLGISLADQRTTKPPRP